MIGDIIRKIREARKSHEWMLPVLLEELGTSREVSVPGPRDWLSASKVPGHCPRAHVMGYRMGVKLVDTWDAQKRWNADKGTAIHIVVQEMWLGPRGWLRGGWKCFECARVHTRDMAPEVTPENSIPAPNQCIECGFEPNVFDRFGYVEPWIKDTVARIRGRTDGIIEMPACPEEILDIKSTGSFKWNARRNIPGDKSWDLREAPKKEHVQQLHLYMGPSRIRNGRLLYINPGEKQLHKAIIEHKIEFDPGIWHQEREKIIGLRKALEDKTRPVPCCPYGGFGTYGDCACIEMEGLWARHGH